MSNAISARGIGKHYTLKHQSQQRHDSLRDVLGASARRLWQRLQGQALANQAATRESFWALQDISFEIKTGERVGIIGRNGAGKSTLLKVLSRIVEPTTGQIRIKGRVSSLLEVGTGFHPELTGRENIFLNGAVMGMRRQEIMRKFDEIVDFAEVEQFLDTPVKHYSSGMYVRLAFAVAAHLEPEILIVDEVLAVGDAEFQKKCLGKMESAGREGRTVLFVSHSMPTVTSLCDRAILLDRGKVIKDGTTSDVIMSYYSNGSSTPFEADFTDRDVGDIHARLIGARVLDHQSRASVEISINKGFSVCMDFEVAEALPHSLVPNFYFMTASGECAFVSVCESNLVLSRGIYTAKCELPAHLLNEGAYFVGLAMSSFGSGVKVHFFEANALSFNVADAMEGDSARGGWAGAMPGVVRPRLNWYVTQSSV